MQCWTGKWRCLLRVTVSHFSCKWVIRCIFGDGCGHNLELNQLPLCVFYLNRGVITHTALGYIQVIVRSQCFFIIELPTDRSQSCTWNSRWSISQILWLYLTYQSAELSIKKKKHLPQNGSSFQMSLGCLSMTFKWTNNTFTVLH